MSLTIALDHPTLLLKTKMVEITSPFLNSFGFNYFQYLRCFSNGAIGLLTNHTGLMEYIPSNAKNEPVVFSSFSEENKNAHSFWFTWDGRLPEMPLTIAREKFNIRHGITLVRRARDYYDMIAVALPIEVADPALFYLNKLKAIEQFINAFDYDYQELIQIMHKNPVALPPAYRDVNYKELCLSNNRVEVIGRRGKTYLTSQELICLRLFVQGVSYKEIAQRLALSPRTVETYVQRAKLRTEYRSRFELERMLAGL